MTGEWTARQLQAIDQRIAVAAQKFTDVGVVVSVSTDRQRAMVTAESATVAVPVKVSGTVWCQAGDKVGLTRYGAEWYVTAILNRIQGPNVGALGGVGVSGSVTSGTPVNVPGDPSFTWTKRWDATPITLFAGLSFFISTAAASCAVSMRFAGPTTVTYKVWEQEPSNQLERYGWSHMRDIPDATDTSPLPAGTYTVNLQWYRTTGTGTIQQNNDDWYSAWVQEGGK